MVSICIASYNGCKYIRQQLVSILAQLSCNDEIVISDDNSSDGTRELVLSMDDSRIKLFLNSGRHGVVPNFENAIRHTSGDCIFLCDQDDVWEKNKVNRCLEVLQSADLVVHNLLVMNGEGCVSDMDFFSIRHSREGYWRNLYKNSFMGCCMAFRRDILNYLLPFPEGILWHDMWIGLMVEKKGKVKFIDDKLLYYRRHGSNVSATAEKSSFSLFFQIKYRLQMLYYTMIR